MRDLRRYAQTTTRRLVLGALFLVFVVGDGLVWLIYGEDAGRAALLCSGLGLAPVVLIFVALELLSWVARVSRRE